MTLRSQRLRAIFMKTLNPSKVILIIVISLCFISPSHANLAVIADKSQTYLEQKEYINNPLLLAALVDYNSTRTQAGLPELEWEHLSDSQKNEVLKRASELEKINEELQKKIRFLQPIISRPLPVNYLEILRWKSAKSIRAMMGEMFSKYPYLDLSLPQLNYSNELDIYSDISFQYSGENLDATQFMTQLSNIFYPILAELELVRNVKLQISTERRHHLEDLLVKILIYAYSIAAFTDSNQELGYQTSIDHNMLLLILFSSFSYTSAANVPVWTNLTSASLTASMLLISLANKFRKDISKKLLLPTPTAKKRASEIVFNNLLDVFWTKVSHGLIYNLKHPIANENYQLFDPYINKESTFSKQKWHNFLLSRVMMLIDSKEVDYQTNTHQCEQILKNGI